MKIIVLLNHFLLKKISKWLKRTQTIIRFNIEMFIKIDKVTTKIIRITKVKNNKIKSNLTKRFTKTINFNVKNNNNIKINITINNNININSKEGRNRNKLSVTITKAQRQ